MTTDNIEDLPKYDMSLISSEQYAMVVQGNALLGTALKNERDSKVAMLKHIDDLEAALKNAVEMWDVEYFVVFNYESMITGVKEQFSYLFDGSTPMSGAELIAEDDGWHEDMTDAELEQMLDEQMDAMKQYKLRPCKVCGSAEIGPEDPSEGMLIACDDCGSEFNIGGETTLDAKDGDY